MEEVKNWVNETNDVAAVTIREHLKPVGGEDDVIFPPTFADPKGSYAIDQTENGNVCLIDTVGSQANRMEPLFKEDILKNLVPQIIIEAGTEKVNLLDAGHRVADAIIRFSELSEEISKAFLEHDAGNSEPLAKIAPTSLVFGAWDSRETEVKISRIVSSVIRAYNVDPLKRSATYVPPLDYVEKGLIDESDAKKLNDEKVASQIGLSHVPSRGLGGIIVRGDIRRDAVLNVSTIKRYFVRNGEEKDVDRTQRLREYLLGLALCVALSPCKHDLRQGCLLVRDIEQPIETSLVYFDGKRDNLSLSFEEALGFAANAAETFGVGESRIVKFEKEKAKKAIADVQKKKK